VPALPEVLTKDFFEMWKGRPITPEEMPDYDDIIQAILSVTISKDIAV
jgi:hypothetical protein